MERPLQQRDRLTHSLGQKHILKQLPSQISIKRNCFIKIPNLETHNLAKIYIMFIHLQIEVLFYTENGFNKGNFEFWTLPNIEFANAYCRQLSKGVEVAICLKHNFTVDQFSRNNRL